MTPCARELDLSQHILRKSKYLEQGWLSAWASTRDVAWFNRENPHELAPTTRTNVFSLLTLGILDKLRPLRCG
jgi:hypothetical protein